jgi:16S rRNA processing protein RimM
VPVLITQDWHFYLHRISSMTVEECFKIGYIAKTHGLKGEVTIVMSPECPEIDELESLFVEINQNLIPYFLQSVSIKGDKAYIKFEDVNSIDQANDLKGCSLYLKKAERVKLSRGEFYNDEVLDFEVADKEAGVIGTVKEIFESGPNRFLVLNGKKEIMIPLNGPFIKSVNKSKKKISVELPDGFLDI